MQPVEVIALFTEQGVVSPVSIKQGYRQSPVDKIGKQWEDETGIHFIVYLPVEKVVELVYMPSTSRWYLMQAGRANIYG